MKKLWAKRWFRVITIFFSVFLLLFLLRNPILRGTGNWLAKADPLVQTQGCFVLGGNSYERGMAATLISKQFPEQQFIATGGNYPYQIMCLDTSMYEAELTRHMMVNRGVPNDHIQTMTGAHSTMEESDEILNYCRQNNLNDIMVISSAFHLRRVRWVFEDKFSDAGIRVHFFGAGNDEYNSNNWWHNEEGLIMANNEIVKLIYYLVKY